ncbi:MAG: baseplate protein J [Calothrix sp. MO_167.B12]|nr:baseplate protein J [Calothrix sp. MO_167.B12]
MTLPLPNLDDHTYADLVESAISQISLEYPEWTDYNPSDTGIILIELLAWLSEMTLYRVNQIGDENYASFVSLLKGEQWNLTKITDGESLQSEINNTLLELRKRHRAVTTLDYEQIIIEDWNTWPDSDLKIARVKCLPQRNLSEYDVGKVAKGNISLIVVPEQNIQQTNNNYQNLLNFLNERKLLTTRLHIVEPLYVSVAITADIVVENVKKAKDIKENKNAEKEIEWFFHPLHSEKYWDGKGWPFGRGVYLSELYKILDNLEGVDYVENVQINDSESDIDLADNQLVSLDIKNSTITILVDFENERRPIEIS